MGHFQLAFGIVVNALAVAKEFAGAENRGERIVQLVSDASQHLAHGGKLFGLNKLALQALDFGDIAAGYDHAFDLSFFIKEWAEVALKAAPFALGVTHANFDGREILLAGD